MEINSSEIPKENMQLCFMRVSIDTIKCIILLRLACNRYTNLSELMFRNYYVIERVLKKAFNTYFPSNKYNIHFMCYNIIT